MIFIGSVILLIMNEQNIFEKIAAAGVTQHRAHRKGLK